eukprot:m.430276 g.430276  ORF g.430276 m.430276 type:complete len:246 (-) comp17143_c0_seq1:4966-5703(-)
MANERPPKHVSTAWDFDGSAPGPSAQGASYPNGTSPTDDDEPLPDSPPKSPQKRPPQQHGGDDDDEPLPADPRSATPPDASLPPMESRPGMTAILRNTTPNPATEPLEAVSGRSSVSEGLDVRSPSYEVAQEEGDQHRTLTMWKGLQAHVKTMQGGKARQGCTWYTNVVKGSQVVSSVLSYLHSRDEPQYRSATREQATGIAQMLADQNMLIPANDFAMDGVSDSPKCFFYVSGTAAEGAVGLVR